MKLGLAVLPLEVWADIFLSPYQWITRQELAQFYNNIKDRGFARKLEKLLHDCGKPSLRFLRISNPTKSLRRNRTIPELQALLTVAPCFLQAYKDYKECEFPEIEMPENIKTFKQLEISYLDDQVLDFLAKIKKFFTNIVLGIESTESAYNLRILFTHLLPTIGSIRRIQCDDECLEMLARHYPGTLTMARELQLFYFEPASIPSCLNWLSVPRDFDVDGLKVLDWLLGGLQDFG